MIQFELFHHPCFRDTYIERKAGESVNDRNDRAIRVATAWYASHLAQSQPKPKNKNISLVLLTDDAANCKKAKEEGLLASTGVLLYFSNVTSFAVYLNFSHTFFLFIC